LGPRASWSGRGRIRDAVPASLLVTNARRSSCKVCVYEVTTLTGSQTTDINPAQLVQGPFDLDSTENLAMEVMRAP
jgi:hypothetical protein